MTQVCFIKWDYCHSEERRRGGVSSIVMDGWPGLRRVRGCCLDALADWWWEVIYLRFTGFNE
jgi:hypothetical protein